MSDVDTLNKELQNQFPDYHLQTKIALGELTVEVPNEHIHAFCLALRDKPEFKFEQLIDLCGVDYSEYGVAEWSTEKTTLTGFSRGVEKTKSDYVTWDKPRFAVVYHLLSVSLNHRIRLRTFVKDDQPIVDSVIDIWTVADFLEREAFDLFGILFDGHPDLRRLLTDYGFVGHPFRKDFPLEGYVEPRYDATQQRIVYEPVSIKPRTLVPKVIRQDTRYAEETKKSQEL